ncbi:MAG: branched-chain amino acid ABC transporter substrate-binding protein [Methylacidiphilales bacterium]|nr:branched-chain amino acid ABC transporter substrate-binding protein [Candidatus Methylacidiphilales bacterium]
MRKLFLWPGLALIVVVGVALTACQKSGGGGDTIKIGLAAVESGSDAQIGSTMLQGSQIAVDEWNNNETPLKTYHIVTETKQDGSQVQVKLDEWNAKGGVLGKQIETISLDDEGKPDKAVNVAQTLVDDGVVGVLGHLNSGCTIPASRVYNQAGIIQITPGSTNPQYTEQGYPYAFRICGRDDQQGAVAGAFLHDQLKLNKIAILHNKTAYGEGLATEVKKTFESKGGTVVVFDGIGQDENDYSANVSKIKGSGAEAFFWGGMYGQGGPLCVKMRQAGVNIPFVSGDGCFDQSFINTVGASAPDVYLSFGRDYHKIPAAQPFLDKYKAKYGHDEGAYSVYGYDAANVLLTAIAQAQTTDADKVAAVMKSRAFDTILGQVEFDAKGDTKTSGFVIWTIKDGKLQALPDNP